jgi:hypothetical protein
MIARIMQACALWIGREFLIDVAHANAFFNLLMPGWLGFSNFTQLGRLPMQEYDTLRRECGPSKCHRRQTTRALDR